MTADEPSSTTSGIEADADVGAAAAWVRRGFITLLAIVILFGLLDLLGVKSRTVSANAPDDAVRVEVHYAEIARAGLDVPFRITVARPGGFDHDVAVAVTSDYLDLFDRSSVDPTPASATATPREVIWKFNPPPGDRLEISVDMQVQGGRHWGQAGTVTVLDGAGSPLVHVHLKTWLAP